MGCWFPEAIPRRCILRVEHPRDSRSVVCISLECTCSALTWFGTPWACHNSLTKPAITTFRGELEPNVLGTSREQAVLWDLCSTIQKKVLAKHIQTLSGWRQCRLSKLPKELCHKREPSDNPGCEIRGFWKLTTAFQMSMKWTLTTHKRMHILSAEFQHGAYEVCNEEQE